MRVFPELNALSDGMGLACEVIITPADFLCVMPLPTPRADDGEKHYLQCIRALAHFSVFIRLGCIANTLRRSMRLAGRTRLHFSVVPPSTSLWNRCCALFWVSPTVLVPTFLCRHFAP